MRVHYDIDQLPEFKNAIITIGSFDGVHKGHKKIIQRMNNLADDIDGESIIITFHPHPRKIIYPNDNSLQLLNTLDEKLELFEKSGIDHVVIVKFSVEFSQQSPREYLDKFIVKRFNPSYVIIGYDHRFGLNREGDIHFLRRYANEHGFKVIEIKKQELEDITISSTKIRNALQDGDLQKANSFLGYPYLIKGKVVYGDQIGKQLGYPTANISLAEKEKMLPKEGVYAVNALVEGDNYHGMMYIGGRPTINTLQKVSIEVHLFEFSENIYDLPIEVEVLSFIRGDQKFNDLEELRKQLKKDEKNVLNLLATENEKKKSLLNLSIAILNFNGKDYLEAYLPSVVEACPENGEIVVIDNNSDDQSIPFLEEWYPEVRIIELSKNYGFAEGYNKGMKYIETAYTLILNSDVRVEDDAVQLMLRYIDNKPDIAAIQPRVMSLEFPDQYEYAGAAGGLMDRFGYPFCRGRVLADIEPYNENYKDEEIFWASGAAMLVRTDVFKNLGGFDGSYFAHQEEIDFCWRSKLAGYQIKYCNEAVVYHLGGGTLSYENPQKTYLNFRNNLMTIIKNESFLSLIWLIPVRIILDCMAGVKYLLEINAKSCWAIVRAYFYIISKIYSIGKTKKRYSKLIEEFTIRKPNLKGRYNGSILLQYYLFNHKEAHQFYSMQKDDS